jgi:cell division protease FtsH
MGLETVESQYLEGRSSMNCADNTAAEVDNEVMNILKECYGEALGMLRENREVMDKIAEHLIVKETITGKEFMKIYREAKGLPEPEPEEKQESTEKQAPAVSLDKPVYVPSPEELRNEQPQQGDGYGQQMQPTWNRPYEQQPQQQQPQQPWQQPQPQNNNTDGSSDKSNDDDNKEHSQFGSAWDQNVNGRR